MLPGALRRGLHVLLLVTLAGALVLSDLPLCPLARGFHTPCPACGLTRATLALLHGDLAGAVRLHPLAPVVVPVVALYVGWRVLREIAGKTHTRVPLDRAAERVLGALVIAGFLLWLARFAGAFGGPVAV